MRTWATPALKPALLLGQVLEHAYILLEYGSSLYVLGEQELLYQHEGMQLLVKSLVLVCRGRAADVVLLVLVARSWRFPSLSQRHESCQCLAVPLNPGVIPEHLLMQ